MLSRPEFVELRAEIHAQVDAVVALPGGAAWRAARNEIDGQPGEFTDRDGQAAVRVSAGVHSIVRTLSTGGSNEIPIALPSAPGRIETKLDGWQVSGLRDDGTAGEALHLVRVQQTGNAGGTGAAGGDAGIPPLARIERRLSLGSRWQVHTVIQRIDGGNRPQEVRVALLPGEAVTTPTIRVAGAFALVNLAPGTAAAFDSDLPTQGPITLQAGKEPGQLEVWNLEASTLWSVALGGTPPVLHVRNGLWSPQWRPWPGESARLTIKRPEGVPGSTLTIDAAQLRVTPGAQATDVRANATIRATLSGTHRFELPEGAKILGLKKDGRDLPAYTEGRNVPILIEPGVHEVELAWREDRGIQSAFHLPQLGLGASAVNASLETTLPADRWLLFTSGPTVGPVVLFWSILVVLVAVALLLARLVRSPLSSAAWIVLAVGAGQAGLYPALTRAGIHRRGECARALGRSARELEIRSHAGRVRALRRGCDRDALRSGAQRIAGPTLHARGRQRFDDMMLRWYQDRVAGITPAATIISLPLWVWRIAMLAWSVWLALTLVRIAGWTWQAFGRGGRWQTMRTPKPQAPQPTAPPEAPAPAA